ncbi:hypothetical protein TNCV_2838981 [Trichonephila clavipes]|nr:hypothetical protein TNCV_2838981 [Trichonephila clavipes]
MAQIHAEGAAEQHAARLEEAHLRAHHSCFTTLERCQPETAHLRHTRLNCEQSRNNSHLAFRFNPVEDCRIRQHVLINTMMEVYPYCNVLEFKGETKVMFCTTEKIKLPQLGEPQSH